MNTYTAVIASMLGIAGGGWGAHEYLHSTFAYKEAAQIAENKADFVIDQQMAALISQIAFLERKVNKTSGELQQLQYLRGQLDIMRKVRSGK